jgi:hypothetical protein
MTSLVIIKNNILDYRACKLFYKEHEILKDKNIRKSVPSPSLTDSEVITMEIIGEYLSQKSDTAIWNDFKMHS